MSIQEAEAQIRKIDEEIRQLEQKDTPDVDFETIKDELEKARHKIMTKAYANLSSYDKVYLARKPTRPNVRDYIENLFDHFFEQRGDRLYRDDHSIIGGIAMFHDMPVTVIGHQKGKNLEENLLCNFGMPNPEGYRKALRLMKQAEKFKRPIITFIDTAGAYPGIEAEEHGQGEAIARNLMAMCNLTVPVISIVIGEGGSGGALALSVANRIWMLENAVYSILSPEGFATILWKDSTRAQEASEIMKLTAQDLYAFNIVDVIVKEPMGNLNEHAEVIYAQLRDLLNNELTALCKLSERALLDQRYKKFRSIGDCSGI